MLVFNAKAGELREVETHTSLGVFFYNKDEDISTVVGKCPYWTKSWQEALAYLHELSDKNEHYLDDFIVVIKELEYLV